MNSTAEKTNGFVNAIKNEESLKVFVRKMAEFDEKFCEAMEKGGSFTIRLEVNGERGQIKHVRIHTDDFEKPKIN